MSLLRQRRSWRTAAAAAHGEGFTVRLDDRALLTAAGRLLIVPGRALAEGVAAEWAAVEGEIRPETMPLTRRVNTAIDRIAPAPGPVVAEIAGYGETDLLCYRAGAPAGLRQRQDAAWDPPLAWAEEALGAPLRVVTGVMHAPQPAPSLARLRAAVAAETPFGLAGLADLVALSGSLVLGLAVARGALAPGEGWRLSRIDETWQQELWGEDAEAARAAAAAEATFREAAAFLRLLDPGA